MNLEDRITEHADGARETYLQLRGHLHEVGRLRERSDTIQHINKVLATCPETNVALALEALVDVLEVAKHETVNGGALRAEDEADHPTTPEPGEALSVLIGVDPLKKGNFIVMADAQTYGPFADFAGVAEALKDIAIKETSGARFAILCVRNTGTFKVEEKR